METKKIGEQFSSLSDNAKEYINLKYQYYKLAATEKVSRIMTILMISIIIFVLVMLILFFLSHAFILLWGEYIGPSYVGALIVAGFYLVVGVLIYLLRYPLLINPLVSSMSNTILEDQDDA